MDLWIRSQDKTTLILAQHLDIYDCTLEDDEEQHWWIEESGVDLGEYPSKERALEVLDEIDEIKWYKYMAEVDWKHFIEVLLRKPEEEQYKIFKLMNTYEMPKE